MLLFKNQNRQIRPNFTEKELFSKSSDAPDSHFLNDRVVDAVQAVRDYFGVPVSINSSYRTFEHNRRVGGSPQSQHLRGFALDFTFSDKNTLERTKSELAAQRGELWNRIRMKGVTAVGIYDGFIHIDARERGGLQRGGMGSYAFWDNRSGSDKKKA